MAFVGFNSLTDALPAYSADELRMIMGSSKVAISQATGLIQIKSTTTTLLVVLTGLIDVLKATTVQDGVTTLPLTAAAIAALEAYKLVIEQVLY